MVTATLAPQPKPARRVHHSSVEGWHPKHNPWLIALTVTLATFMEVLDTSIANVALPHMAGTLGASQEEATWVLTSYLVSSAIVLPISGWLSTRFGRKRFYMTCVALFTICSLLCGLAPTLPFLILARILQGLGGGGLAPSEQAILADTFPVEQRGQAFALYGMAVVAAPAIGPTLGGWITDNFNWHWIFFINLPIGILSLLLSNRMVEDPPYLVEHKAKAGPIDKMGLGLVAVGVGCLEFVLDKGQEKDWFGDRNITFTFMLAIVTLAFFVWWEWRHPDPIVDLKLLKNRNFGTAVGFQFILGMVLFSTTVLIPQFLQGLMGYTAERAGMALSAGAVVLMVMMPVAGKLVSIMDARLMVSIGFLATSLGALQHDPAGLEREFRAHRDVASISGAGTVVHLYPHQHPELCGRADGQEQPDLKLFQLRPQLWRQHGHCAFDYISCPHPADPPVIAGGKFHPRQRGLRELSRPGQGRFDSCRTVCYPG